jgi:hypothetical protein
MAARKAGGRLERRGKGIDAKYPFMIEELIVDGPTLRIFPREAHNDRGVPAALH